MWLMHEKQPFTAILEKDLFELLLTLLLPAGGGGGVGGVGVDFTTQSVLPLE